MGGSIIKMVKYNKEAVDKAIKKDPKIKGKEATVMFGIFKTKVKASELEVVWLWFNGSMVQFGPSTIGYWVLFIEYFLSLNSLSFEIMLQEIDTGKIQKIKSQ